MKVNFRLPWIPKLDRPMGINSRNLVISRLNPPGQTRWLNNKILTREICCQNDVPCPDIFGIVRNRVDIAKVGEFIMGRQDFVIKPARGSKGKGILVIKDRSGDHFIDINNRVVSIGEIEHHLNEILYGVFSMSEVPDHAIIEQRVAPHEIFVGLSPAGTPDIRVILINSEVVLAMVRIPTLKSRGRANLSLGAVAAGVDIKSGVTFGGIVNSCVNNFHPDTGEDLRTITVPFWHDILNMSKRFVSCIESAYVGVDIVIDNSRGPLLLEANNRPGLQIQLANQKSLKPYFCSSQDLRLRFLSSSSINYNN